MSHLPSSAAPNVALRIEDICTRFEQVWLKGSQPRLDDFLGSSGPEQYPHLVRELILLDVHYRRRAGQTPHPDDYQIHCPEGSGPWLGEVCSGTAGPAGGTVGCAVGTKVGEYELLEELGRGGMGVVYKARQPTLKRLVAIKMILDGEFADPQAQARIRTEAEAIARLQHPNIVQVYEIGMHEGKPFLSLEFCGGGSLQRQLGGTPQPARKAAQLVATMARAVQTAHAKQVIHRDLKPANVLLTEDGTLKISDFGLAKKLDAIGESASGAVIGTPSYMAPEQASGNNKSLGPACDVYALGAILYELLTGRPPFKAATMVDTFFQVVHDEPVPPTRLQSRTPRDLETIALKCLRKEPEKRYATAEALAEDLEHWLSGRPIQARPVGSLERGYRWCRQNSIVACLLAAVLLLLAGITVGSLVYANRLASAHQAEMEANLQGQYKLWQAYLNEANARRMSGQRGQRFDSLVAIRKALRLPVPPGRSLNELRNAAIAALCLPDIGPGPEWDPAVGPAQPQQPAFRLYLEQRRLWARVPEPKIDPRGRAVSGDCRFVLAALAPYVLDKKMTVPMRLWRMDGPEPTLVFEDPRVYEGASDFRPDSRQIALGHPDGSVTVSDTESGNPIQRLQVDGGPAYCLAFHPKLPRLAVGVNPPVNPASGAAVFIFDLDNGKLLQRLPHPEGVSCLVWRPDGRELVTSCGDMRIRTWDAETGCQVTAPWSGHKSNGIRLSINSAGDRLVSNDWFGHLRLWDAATGREIFTTPESPHRYVDSPPAMLGPVVIGNKLQLLLVAEGHELRQLFQSKPAGKEMGAFSPHPDGRLHATLAGSGLGFLDLATGEEVALIPLKDIAGCTVRFDGSGAMWTGGNGALYRWPIRPPTPDKPAYLVGPPIWVTDVAKEVDSSLNNDGQVVAVPQFSKGTLVLHRGEGGSKVPLQPQYDVRHCTVSPDGHWVATQSHEIGGLTTAIMIWDAISGDKVQELPIARARWVTGFTPDGHWLVTSTEWTGSSVAERNENFQRLWEVGTWKEGRPVPSLGTIFWDQDIVVEGQTDGSMILTQISTGRELARLASPESGRVQPIADSQLKSGFLLARGDESGMLYAWNLPLIRTELAEMGLDWDGPPHFSPAEMNAARAPYTVQVDAGELAKSK